MDPEQPPRRHPRLQRLLPVIVAMVLVIDVAGAVGVAISQSGSDSSQAQSPGHGARARAVGGGQRGSSSPTATHTTASGSGQEGQRRWAVRKLFAQRARAVRTGDRRAFLATVTRGDPQFRASQRRLFSNLSRLPLAGWRYEVRGSGDAPTHARGGQRVTRARAGGRSSANVRTSRVVAHYRFKGFDQDLMSAARQVTATYGPRGWRITDVGDQQKPNIWDFGQLRVVRDNAALVIGLGTPRKRLRAIADRMARAIPVVTSVWGRHWSRRAVVLVPATQRQVEALSPDAGDLDQITAIATVAAGPGGVPPPGTGDRIIVNPATFSNLSSLGKRVVLRHELTHVATRGRTNSTVPMWLIEGFADYVGYHGVDLPQRSIARELRSAVRAGHPPRQLPERGDFDGRATHLTRAYESAWMACEMIAHRHSERRLVRLYRAMSADYLGSSGELRRSVMQSMLGKTPRQFTAAWRSYIQVRLR